MRATLNYGWETPEFYNKWMGGFVKGIAEETSGTGSYSYQPQSKGYLRFEQAFKAMIAEGPKYAERIAKHYKQFRKKVRFSPKATRQS